MRERAEAARMAAEDERLKLAPLDELAAVLEPLARFRPDDQHDAVSLLAWLSGEPNLLGRSWLLRLLSERIRAAHAVETTWQMAGRDLSADGERCRQPRRWQKKDHGSQGVGARRGHHGGALERISEGARRVAGRREAAGPSAAVGSAVAL
jgi:hypothetical protein